MSKKLIPKGSWTLITTTTVPTLISAEIDTVRIYIGSTDELPLNDGHVLHPNEGLVIPAGLVLSSSSHDKQATLIYTAFGV